MEMIDHNSLFVIIGDVKDQASIKIVIPLLRTVWSEGFLYKVAPPELKISPSMYFSMNNSMD